MKRKTSIFTTLLILVVYTVSLSEVILSIDPDTVYTCLDENVITLSMYNPEDEVSDIRGKIFFDTTCFTVTDVSTTNRTYESPIFDWMEIEGGIQIGMIASAHHYDPGTGPMAEIIVDVSDHCLEGEYLWDLSEVEIAGPLGEEFPLTEVDGIVHISGCQPCSLNVPVTELDLGDMWSGSYATTPMIITNIGPAPGNIHITAKGCAWAEPDNFTIFANSTQRLIISCRSEVEGPCEGSLTVSGCGDDITLTVTCTLLKREAILSIEDSWIYPGDECYVTSLDLENNVDVVALQVDMYFDTTCFDVIAVNLTKRSQDMDIFHFSHIDGGIRIALTGLFGKIEPGEGAAVVIFFNMHPCQEYPHIWQIANTVVSDPLGLEINTTVITNELLFHDVYKGDINADGRVNVLDVTLGARILLEHYSPSPAEFSAADFNVDGTITIYDMLHIVNAILAIGTCPP